MTSIVKGSKNANDKVDNVSIYFHVKTNYYIVYAHGRRH